MRRDPSSAVLGFRPHTYWTSAVVLVGRPEAPEVVERRRIVFATGSERFVYHSAAETGPAAAARMVEDVRAATEGNVAAEISRLVEALRGAGTKVGLAVVPIGTARIPDSLEAILRSHALMHAAEGGFYRDVVAAGCQAAGLEVRRVVERDLPALADQVLGFEGSGLKTRLADMGTRLGPPWSEDYRLATLAAWLHLPAARDHRRVPTC